jgi:hypothetical protein
MSDEERALVPIEQKEVEFYGDDLTAVKADDGQVYVALRHLCEALGLNTQAQTRRIQRHPVLLKGYKGVAILATPGGPQRAGVLRVDLVPLWLAGVSSKSVREDGQERTWRRLRRTLPKI